MVGRFGIRLLKRAHSRDAARAEAVALRRWQLVAQSLSPTEAPVACTVAFNLVSRPAPSDPAPLGEAPAAADRHVLNRDALAYVYVTTESLLIAFLTRSQENVEIASSILFTPRNLLGVWSSSLVSISALACDDLGRLMLRAPSSALPETVAILDLAPGPLSQEVALALRAGWQSRTGRVAEGPDGWQLWEAPLTGPPYPPFAHSAWSGIVDDRGAPVLKRSEQRRLRGTGRSPMYA